MVMGVRLVVWQSQPLARPHHRIVGVGYHCCYCPCCCCRCRSKLSFLTVISHSLYRVIKARYPFFFSFFCIWWLLCVAAAVAARHIRSLCLHTHVREFGCCSVCSCWHFGYVFVIGGWLAGWHDDDPHRRVFSTERNERRNENLLHHF